MKRYSVKTFLSILLCTIILVGCKVGKKYAKPELELPSAFRGADTLTQGDSSLAQINWRDMFNDEDLVNLIDSALVNNFDMRIALKNIEIAERNLKINKLQYLPSIDVNLGTVNKQYRSEDFYSTPSSRWYAQNGEEPNSSLYTYQSQFSTGLDFSWELDIWGKIANNGDILKSEWLDSREARHAIQTKLIADVANGYFNLLGLDAQIEVAKRNLQLNDSTMRMIKLQFDAGEITALAMQQTESQRLLAASLIPQLENQIVIQENSLRMLLGEMPDAVLRRKTLNDSIINIPDNISLGAPLDIIRNRPDIKRAEYNLIAANARMNIKQALRYPSLTLSGVFGVNSMLPKNWFNIPGALLGGVIGELTTPLFKNKKLKNQYEVAKIEREKSELSFQRQVMEAVGEIANTINTVRKQQEQLELSEKRVVNSELAVKNASLLFKSGYATYLEVITAQSNALNSDLDLVSLQQKQLNAFIKLYRALGGGWE